MTSASTKRRHKRNAEIYAEWVGTPIGQRVTVTRANGKTLKAVTTSGPMMVDNKHAMICVEGIPGNTRLERVRLGWNPGPEYADERLPWNPRAEKEIQRLRAAMVYAMDDCMTALHVPGRMRDTLEVVARNLKAALEKK